MAVQHSGIIESGPAEPGGDAVERQPWPRTGTAWFAVAVFAVALGFGEIDRGVIQVLVQPIKHDLQLTDSQMGLLLGLSPVLFYAFIGIPASRLVDTMQRNVILSIGIGIGAIMTSVCGMAQNFGQLFAARVAVGAGAAVHGPGTYSMMADYFPRRRLPRAIAVMQIGYITGGGLALTVGGRLLHLFSGWPRIELPVLGHVHDWQLVLILIGLPGLLVAALQRAVPEPPRRGRMMHGTKQALPLRVIVGTLFRHWPVYGPMFLGLAVSAVESLGTQQWRIAFFQRTYGWSAQQAGDALGSLQIFAALLGLVIGTSLTEWLARERTDANMRAVAIIYTIAFPFAIMGPLMPNPWASVLCSSISYMCGLAGAVPQNAAVQSVTPNEMRGQLTALYLFIFTVVGAGLGPNFIAFITDYILRDESQLRYAMAGSAAVMSPLAAIIMWLGVRPYGRAIAEVQRAEGAGLTH